MSAIDQQSTTDAAVLREGGEREFAALVEPHRQELKVHCYRMLGSLDDAEDQVQETFLRAWRRRSTFEGRSSVRAWLYRIATNACLDALERRPRPAVPPSAFEVPWLQPYPDDLLDRAAPADEEPGAAIVSRETIELAFLVAVQRLAPRPRGVLILRDVLGWSARDTAELLDTSVAAVNSALQRAHSALREHLPEQRAAWSPQDGATAAERELVARYIDASERGDAAGLAALLHEEVRFAMPPDPRTWTGRDEVVGSWVAGGFGTPELGELRCVATRANRQPAVACYVQRPQDMAFRALAVDVLRVEGEVVTEIVTFDAGVFASFGLPAEL